MGAVREGWLRGDEGLLVMRNGDGDQAAGSALIRRLEKLTPEQQRRPTIFLDGFNSGES